MELLWFIYFSSFIIKWTFYGNSVPTFFAFRNKGIQLQVLVKKKKKKDKCFV